MNIRMLSLFIAIALPAGLFGTEDGGTVVATEPQKLSEEVKTLPMHRNKKINPKKKAGSANDKPVVRKPKQWDAPFRAKYERLKHNLMSAIDVYTDAGENPPFQVVEDAAEAIIIFGGQLPKEIPHTYFTCLDYSGHGSETPLTYAIKKGKVGAALVLIEKGASLDVPNGKGHLPIDCVEAIKQSYLDKAQDLSTSNEQVEELQDQIQRYGDLIQYMDHITYNADADSAFSDSLSEED